MINYTTKKLQTLLFSTLLFAIVFVTFDIPQASAEVNLFSGPGIIQGLKWNDENGNGIQDGSELGVAGVEICLANEFGFPQEVSFTTSFNDLILPSAFAIGNGEFGGLACDTTDSDGHYSFVGLELKEYTVYENLPSGTTNTTPLFQRVDLTLVPSVTDVNFGNRVAHAPPPEVGITPSSTYEHEGLPVVYWQSDLVITKDVGPSGFDHCGVGVDPLAVKLIVGPFAETPSVPPVEVMMTNTGGDIWEAAVGPLYPGHGTAPLTFYVDCPSDTVGFPEDISLISGEDEIQDGGNIYIDPSGTVTDVCTGEPLSDVTVTLLVEDIFPPGTFFPAPPSTPPMIPAVNPQTTLPDGHYGWVVIPGSYQVMVEKTGYITQTSTTISIPPAVTDLDFALERVDGCPVFDTLLIQKESTLAQIDVLVDGASDKVIKEADKAKKSILDSLDAKLWNDDGNSVNSKHGDKVFHEEEKAVKSLMKIQKESGLDASGVIGVLLEVDKTLATNAISYADTFDGKKVDKELDKAAKEMSKALDSLNDGHLDQVIHHYEKAWTHAQKAINSAN